MADRLSALLNEDIARKARRAGLTGRTNNYNVIRLADSEFRVRKSDYVIVVGASSQPSSSRFPGDIFVQKGREAVGHGHRNKEDPRCHVAGSCCTRGA